MYRRERAWCVVTVVEREPHGLVALWLVGTRVNAGNSVYCCCRSPALSLSVCLSRHTHDGSMAKQTREEHVGIERGTGGIIDVERTSTSA